MSLIFPILAWLQIAWGFVKRWTLKAIDSLAESSGAYYTGFGWTFPLTPDEYHDTEPTTEQPDPQADYSASNLANRDAPYIAPGYPNLHNYRSH